MSSFKVGDRVKRVNENQYNIRIGDKGTVVDVGNIGCEVEWDRNNTTLGSYNENLELLESKPLSIFDLHEGKVYRSLENDVPYRRVGMEIQNNRRGGGWKTVGAGDIIFKAGFQEVTEETLSVPGLSYEITKKHDGSLEVGCQKIPRESVEKIKEFLGGDQ